MTAALLTHDTLINRNAFSKSHMLALRLDKLSAASPRIPQPYFAKLPSKARQHVLRSTLSGFR
jgi:hypothetical protein